jgi:NAD+ diphosphatase
VATADKTIYIVFVGLDLVVQKSASIAVGGFPTYRPVRFLYVRVKSLLESQQPTVVFLGVERLSGSESSSPAGLPVGPAWFAINVTLSDDELRQLCPGAEVMGMHPRVMMLPRSEAAIVGQARSVLAWHDRYCFCPTCGAATESKDAGYKRRCTRQDCRSNSGIHNTCYPRLDPTIIIAVMSPDRQHLLLGRSRRFPGSMYSCLAGFMEPGESIEEACRREVHEESGVYVGHVEYHSSQPWPMPCSLMLGCIGHANTTDIKIDQDELEDARWFSVQDVRQMLTHQHPQGYFCPPAQTIAHQLIKHSLSIMSKL